MKKNTDDELSSSGSFVCVQRSEMGWINITQDCKGGRSLIYDARRDGFQFDVCCMDDASSVVSW